MTRTRTTVSALAIVLGALLLAAMFSSPRAHAQEPQPTTTVIVDCYGIQGYDATGAPIWGFIPCDDVEEPCQVIAGYDANGKPVYRDVPCDDLPDCTQITHYDPNCHNDDPNCFQLPGIAYVPGVCCEELLGQIRTKSGSAFATRPPATISTATRRPRPG